MWIGWPLRKSNGESDNPLPKDRSDGSSSSPGHLRLSGLHPLLGKVLEGGKGGEAADGLLPTTRAVKAIRAWLRRNLHLPIEDQHAALKQKLLGHYGYYGIIGNARALGTFWHHVKLAWRYWLDRRYQRARMCWLQFVRLLERYPLPLPKLVPRAVPRVANPSL